MIFSFIDCKNISQSIRYYFYYSLLKELQIKLENARTAIRTISEGIGTINLSSSNESSDNDFSPKSNDAEQLDCEFGTSFSFTTNVSVKKYKCCFSKILKYHYTYNCFYINIFLKEKADRYYLNGQIRISKENVHILKGMNSNYLTSTKDHDYRFLSRLLLCIFERDDLANSCVKIEEASHTRHTRNAKYKELDPIKFGFVKCKLNI